MKRVAVFLLAIPLAALICGSAQAQESNRTAFLAHDAQGTAGCIVYIGDSMIRRWLVERVAPERCSVNWGIGGAWIPTVLQHISGLQFVNEAGATVLWIGTNDARSNTAMETLRPGLLKLFKRLPAPRPMVVISLPHHERWEDTPWSSEQGNARVDQLNAELEFRCMVRGACVFVQMPIEEAGADGLHQTPAAYHALGDSVRGALSSFGVQP